MLALFLVDLCKKMSNNCALQQLHTYEFYNPSNVYSMAHVHGSALQNFVFCATCTSVYLVQHRSDEPCQVSLQEVPLSAMAADLDIVGIAAYRTNRNAKNAQFDYCIFLGVVSSQVVVKIYLYNFILAGSNGFTTK